MNEQIKQEDLTKLKTIVKKYKQIYTKISIAEAKLKKITSENEILVNKLIAIRDNEHLLISELKEKYPTIDIQTIVDTTVKSLNI